MTDEITEHSVIRYVKERLSITTTDPLSANRTTTKWLHLTHETNGRKGKASVLPNNTTNVKQKSKGSEVYIERAAFFYCF